MFGFSWKQVAGIAVISVAVGAIVKRSPLATWF